MLNDGNKNNLQSHHKLNSKTGTAKHSVVEKRRKEICKNGGGGKKHRNPH